MTPHIDPTKGAFSMKKMITSALAMILIAGSARAEIIQWQTSGKKVTYAIAGIGALVSFGGKYSESVHKNSFTRKIVGAAIVSLAAQIMYVQLSLDVSAANKQLMSAQHRNLVRFADQVKPGQERALNSNFDDLLSEFECDLDDNEKAVVFATLIKKADELGVAAQAKAKGELSAEVEAQIQEELENSLGDYNSIRNQILIKYIIAQSFLNKAQQASK
jgi:hypothetical protein